MSTQAKTYEFQAEARQLLDIMIHSLYTQKEIFLRELISNASDALDRLRFESLTHPEYLSADAKLEIHLEADPGKRTLTVHDNGIGMSRDEVIANIGTIAKSGTRELIDKLKSGGAPGETVSSLIGRFGVGFYSAFMVADRVDLVTRRAGEASATRWESSGEGTYSIADADRETHGTSITLHLKAVDTEGGLEDFTNRWTLSRIVRRYSDFVAYPILCRELGKKTDADGEDTDKPLNSMKPIWTRPASEVSEEDYKEFYKHISHDWNDPFRRMTFRAEGRTEYQALLFIPSEAPFDLHYVGSKWGLQLYVRRVLIMEDCEDLLPRYLRFVKGVVDSPDLPLNISRQRLQEDRHIAQIRKWLTRKVLDALGEMNEKENDQYLEFWSKFGRVLKEGVSFDYENKDRLTPLLLFPSSHDKEKLTTLRGYVDRMQPDQSEVFYLTGESRSVVENSPHLEALKQRNLEVLFLIEPVDELLVQSLPDFDGKKLKSIGKGTVAFGSEEERKAEEAYLKELESSFAGLAEFLQRKLDSEIKQVRLTNRLVESPVCLVGAEHDYSPQLERLLSRPGGPKQRWILELNPKHEIVTKMRERFEKDRQDPVLEEYAQLLLGIALLAEGSKVSDSVRFTRSLADLMQRGL